MSFDLNKSDSWASEAVYHAPNFDIEGFQIELDEIMGLNEFLTPHVRLVWAGSIKDTYSRFYTSWTSTGQGVDSELRSKYRFASIQIPGTPDIIDVPAARWILEEHNHPGQGNYSWNAARFTKDGKEIRPEAPPHGYYSHLLTIAKHKGNCCKDALEQKLVCWGRYRQPGEIDLRNIREAKHKRGHDTEIDITRPLTERDILGIGRETDQRITTRREAGDEELRQYIDENALELIEMFTGRKFSDKVKKFAFPKALKGANKTTENGIILPK